MTSIAIEHKQAILERVEAGEYLGDIAKSYGISASAICNQLSGDPEYIVAQEYGYGSKVRAREVELEDATDAVGVSRARELASLAKWWAANGAPHIYARDKQPAVTVNLGSSYLDLLKQVDALDHPPVQQGIDQTPHTPDSGQD